MRARVSSERRGPARARRPEPGVCGRVCVCVGVRVRAFVRACVRMGECARARNSSMRARVILEACLLLLALVVVAAAALVVVVVVVLVVVAALVAVVVLLALLLLLLLVVVVGGGAGAAGAAPACMRRMGGGKGRPGRMEMDSLAKSRDGEIGATAV